METLEAIFARRSVKKMKAEAVPPALVEKLLDAAVQAPNHYKVRPWRFVVLRGDGLKQLGEVFAQSLMKKVPNLPPEALEKERAKPLRAPLIIAVGVDQPADARVIEIENICAAAAACQNILLAAQALGLGSHWRTGEAARDPAVKKFLGFSEEQHLIAFLYIGYAELVPEPIQREGFADRTVWLDS